VAIRTSHSVDGPHHQGDDSLEEKTMNMMWSVISAAAVLSIAALATAWAQSKIGAAGAATLAEKPQLATTMIIMLAIPETMVILGFVVAVLIILRGGGG
jgi:V/A-type H+-transporting ATPase subunit K